MLYEKLINGELICLIDFEQMGGSLTYLLWLLLKSKAEQFCGILNEKKSCFSGISLQKAEPNSVYW